MPSQSNVTEGKKTASRLLAREIHSWYACEHRLNQLTAVSNKPPASFLFTASLSKHPLEVSSHSVPPATLKGS